MPIRIGIDLHYLDGIYQGVRTYLEKLIPSLLRTGAEMEFFLYRAVAEATLQANAHLRPLPSRSGKWNQLWGFRSLSRRDALELFHGQYMLPLGLRCRKVVTVHDILYERSPRFFPLLHRVLLRLAVKRSVAVADVIISVSEFTKRELIHFYGVPEGKIRVIPEGVDPAFHPIQDQALVREVTARYGVRAPYVLFVGRLEPRKNLRGLLAALERLCKREAIPRDLSLVVVGSRDRLFRDRTFERNGKMIAFNNRLVFTGPVPEADLPALYSGSEVFAYPSFAEGFGLPVLEAMACGAPVVTSMGSALDELVAGAALQVDPANAEALADALGEVLANPGLRERLSQAGRCRAEEFRWERTAALTIQAYRAALGD